MKVKAGFALAVLLLAASLLSCASGGTKPLPLDMPVVRDISAFYNRLDNAVAPQSFIQVKTLGEVVYGEYKAPVKLYSIFNRSGSKHKVFLSGGIHGNEPGGVETLAEFIESLARDPSKYSGISFEIVPVINPWAWSHDVRFNREGKDVNRDLGPQVTQEAKILAGYLKQNRYDLMIDHHEDPDAKGFYLYQYAMPGQTLPRKIIQSLKGDGYPAEQNISMVILKTDDGLIDAPMWGLWYMRASGQIGSANYSRLYNSDDVYTIETPTGLELKDRLTIHRKAQEMMLESLLSR